MLGWFGIENEYRRAAMRPEETLRSSIGGAGAQVNIERLFRAFAGQPGDNQNLGAGAHGGQGAHETRQSSKRSNPQRKPDGNRARLEVSASTYLGKTAGAT